jgi:class 3 adenylate cyclase
VGAPIVVERSFRMAAAVERAWPLLVDTERFNRLSGLAAVTYQPIEDGTTSAARFIAETRAGGFKLVYDEYPYEWSYLRRFGVYRRMRGGPVESYAWRCDFEPTDDGGTAASVRFEITPRTALLRPIAWMNARKFTRQLAQLGERVDAFLLHDAPSPYATPASSPASRERVVAAIAELEQHGVRGELARRLATLVTEAPDVDVVRVRPYELADRWGEDRRDVLRACLRAVPAGLFELRWGLICPSCLTASEQLHALDEITESGHCQLCDIRYELGLDRAVEATFLPHPAVRRVTEQLFCAGGPARTPHVLVQAQLDAGAARALDVPREPGRYRVFVRGGATTTLEVDADGEPRTSARVDGERITPPRVHAAPGGELVVESACADARHVKIERLEFASTAASAHAVSTLPEFRTLFASDVLKPGTPLKVARAAMLFTDLTGSTALYSTLGDAAAFRLVDDHFDVVREVIEEREGVVVKTMGDAVMAAFVDAAACARAAIDVLARFDEFRATSPARARMALKLGMFAGACYVVTANGALDYFGQTVNVASRVQHLAGPHEVVLPRDVFDGLDAAVRVRLSASERFTATVKGFEQTLELVRATLAAARNESAA